MDMPFHWDKKATQYYTQSQWLRAQVKCDEFPLPAFHNRTNDDAIPKSIDMYNSEQILSVD